jgi:tRNA-2-methylthio-N6-dimethylallyladenosine synthase
VKKLADAGVREVTLLGQTVNRYAYQNGDGRCTTFADLLYQVHEAVPHLPRLRFVTSFPRDFTDEALAAVRDCRRICRYLHVPAQSGADRILKAMNRGYTAGEYLEFAGRARDMLPDVAIASDFIVGFPGETEEDHSQSLEMIRRCRFKNSFIFKYSPRPGTMAKERFADGVPEEVKRRRNAEMLAVQQEVSLEINRAMIGQTVEVIVEGESQLGERQSKGRSSSVEVGWEKRDRTAREHDGREPSPQPSPGALREGETQLVGRTGGDHVVCFDGLRSFKGQIIRVQITAAYNMTLFAETLKIA